MENQIIKHSGIDEVIKDMYVLKPFYGYILYRVHRKWDKSIPTACVDNKRNLRINKEFFNSLDYSSKMAIVEHEVLHLALLHISRFHVYIKDPLYRDIANIAMDCAINQLLTFKLNNNDKYVTLQMVEKLVGSKLEPFQHAEYYFRKLLEKRQEIMDKLQKNGSLDKIKKLLKDIGEGHGRMIEGSEDDSGMIDPLSESIMKQILQRAKEVQNEHDRQAGVGAGNYFTSFLPEYVDVDKNIWKRLINRTIGNEPCADKEYIFGKVSRRKNDSYWGYKHLQVSNKVYIGIDTSGSTISEQNLFAGVVAKALRTQEMSATVIQCDYDIQEVKEKVTRISINKNFNVKGGGGTDLTKILDYIEEKERGRKVRLVMLTDGYTPWRNSNSIITTCIYTRDHSKLDNIMYSAVLEK